MNTTAEQPAEHWDVVVVGSGFGGSVAALRLSEKGYRVLVVESGRRFADDELPKTSWRLPQVPLGARPSGMFGIQRITLLNDVLVLSGAGVGGGSLVYGNTLYEPLDDFYEDPQWSHITKWRDELAPHYEQAKRMLGVVENPVDTAADQVMLEVAATWAWPTPSTARRWGCCSASARARTVDDPFFGGAGPARTTCTSCGGVHDRLPGRGEEHPAEELPAPGRGARRADPAAHHGHRDRARGPRAATGSSMRAAGPGAGGPTRSEVTADHVILAAGHAGHPAAAAPDEGRRACCPASPTASASSPGRTPSRS